MLKTELRPSQKIDLLLDALDGEAKAAAGRAEKRDNDELLKIWGKLVQSYDNQYQQVYAHIFDIIYFPKINSPSLSQYRNMVNQVEEHLRLLTRYKVGLSEFLCILFLQKIDAEARYKWNEKTCATDLPNLDTLFKFMTERGRALDNEEQSKSLVVDALNNPQALPAAATAPTPSGAPQTGVRMDHYFAPPVSYERKERTAKSKIGTPYERPNYLNRICEICDEQGHFILFCPMYTAMNKQQRHDVVKKKKLCARCLWGNHSLSQCKKIQKCIHHPTLCFVEDGQHKEAPKKAY